MGPRSRDGVSRVTHSGAARARARPGLGILPDPRRHGGFLPGRACSNLLCLHASALASRLLHQNSGAMDMNDYVFEIVARERLAELRKAAEDSSWARTGGLGPSRLRVALGRALIRIGRRLQGAHERAGTSIGVGAVRTSRGSAHGAIRG